MKQPSPIVSIVDMSASVGADGGVRVSGFHPDFLLPLIDAIDNRLFITINDGAFASSVKYLSRLWDSGSVVFVSDSKANVSVPAGFAPSDDHFTLRAREVLAGGLGPIKIIVSSGGGVSLPILGCGIDNRLVFELGVSFEECYDFLVSENYVLSDFVAMPGEFSTRGGIIDVFPFSSYCPYRINFLDEFPIVFSFNVDSQLTTERVNNLVLSSVSKNKPLALKDVSLKEFLPVALDSDGELIIGNPNKILKKMKKIQPTFAYYSQLKKEEKKQEIAEGIRALIKKAESITDLGEFKQRHPGNVFLKELNDRLLKLADLAMVQARSLRGERRYHDAAAEFYSVNRYSPDPKQAELARDELRELQQLRK